MKKYRLLYVDDETAGRETVSEYLRGHGYEVEVAATAADALARLDQTDDPFAAIIVDFNLKGDAVSGAGLTRTILDKDPEAYVIVYSSDPSQSAATESWSAGAVGFVKKEPGDALLERVQEQCAKFDETRAILSAKHVRSVYTPVIAKAGMVGSSANLARAVESSLLYQDSPDTVLIYGESGAGKEKLARTASAPGKPFLAINCAAFKNEDLLEGELFGYEKGAFTGADRQKIGLFQMAGHGTIFLDEIHEMSLGAQSKLLRSLQERNFRRMGGLADISFHCRIIVASKPDLPELVESGKFKRDLFYRISKLPILIAPLRERRDDIAPLIAHFTNYYNDRDKTDKA